MVWLGDIENDRDAVLVVLADRPLVGASSVASDETVRLVGVFGGLVVGQLLQYLGYLRTGVLAVANFPGADVVLLGKHHDLLPDDFFFDLTRGATLRARRYKHRRLALRRTVGAVAGIVAEPLLLLDVLVAEVEFVMVDVLRGERLVEAKLAFEAAVGIADFGLVAGQRRLAVRKHEGTQLAVLLPLIVLWSHFLPQLYRRVALQLGVAQPTVRCEHASGLLTILYVRTDEHLRERAAKWSPDPLALIKPPKH